jgi:selenocysteine lyase/cysteine desulfurase
LSDLELTATDAPDHSESLLQQDPWQWWRRQMPIASRWAYLDHAAVGPLSAPAATALRAYATEAEQQGDTVWPTWARRQQGLREAAAELVGTGTDEICLIPNTSTGINLVAEGFPWRDGDNVVVPEGEFPSNLYPWQNQQSRGVQVRIVPRRDGRVELDDLFAQVDSSTRLIALSWVGYASGFRVDVDELVRRAHRAGVLVFLDAIQGLGIFDLNLAATDVDFLAADGHKWMLGPEGMGIAMIRRRHLDSLRCGNVGWGSVRNSFNYTEPELRLRDSAARFEPGSPNMSGAAALGASLQLFLAVRRVHGPQAIAQRVRSLAAELASRLEQAGARPRFPAEPAHQSGIVTFEVPGRDPAEIRQAALEADCVVSCRDGGVRASVHAYNNQADLERLVHVVAAN